MYTIADHTLLKETNSIFAVIGRFRLADPNDPRAFLPIAFGARDRPINLQAFIDAVRPEFRVRPGGVFKVGQSSFNVPILGTPPDLS